MRRKIDWIIFFGGCAIIVIGLIERSIANTISELDGNSMNDLVADGVKETTTKVSNVKAKPAKKSGKSKSKEKKGKNGIRDGYYQSSIQSCRPKSCERDRQCKCIHITGGYEEEIRKFDGWCDRRRCKCDCDDEWDGICKEREGRPFIIDGNYQTSLSIIGETYSSFAENTWKIDYIPNALANSSMNKAIAMKFVKQGEGEHASIASFARHTLQLMTTEAPALLLMGAQKAALDEIKHAKMCYGIAEAFLGENIRPSSLDVDGSVKSQNKEEVIQSVINEGCIGETIAAVRAQLASQYATQPIVKDSLETIAADESNHAQLAWNTIKWSIDRFPELRDVAEETFKEQLDRPMNPLSSFHTGDSYDCEQDAALREHGLLLSQDKSNTEKFGIKNVINPVVQNELQNVEEISTQILNIDISKY